ncbi:hypothetical protein OIE66_16970 [Nonomuraea sp. NBC_01738]|uniref:hypothetical protein n=1 Tax=Nonomuraea sp. NBC_01738 TaxID=2976003 RepID=UPI002E133CF1|nr:hypothetical protein OIE66_16970 [Nonomuraea sp. NBC_01738]
MEALLGIAVLIGLAYLILNHDDRSDEHPGWRNIPRQSDQPREKPALMDKHSWKRQQRRLREIEREVRRHPPDYGDRL